MAELYIFNPDDKLLTILTESTGLISAPFREELNRVPDEPFVFTVEADTEKAKYVKEENRVVFKDREGNYQEYVIKELDDLDTLDGPETKATCTPVFVDELSSHYVLDKRYANKEAQLALNDALAGTRFEGVVEVSLGLASTNFYKLTSLNCIWKIREVWGGDVKSVVELVDGRISKRKILIKQRLGADRGLRFENDHNIEEIQRTILSYPVTAMYGWGASLETDNGGYTRYIDFADVVWSKASGDPVDKPKGQKWVGDPDALLTYGLKHNGELLHKYDEFSNQDYENPEELLWATWQSLQQAKKPEINYRLSVDLLDKKAELGDTAVAIDRDFARPIEIQTRIIAIEYDLVDIEGTTVVELGEFLNLSDGRLDKVIEEIDKNRPNWDRPQIDAENYPDIRPGTPMNVRAEGGFKVIQLYWDYSSEVYISHYEVYGSQVKSFVPSPATLLWRGDVSAFAHEVSTDQTWYYYVRAVNTRGTFGDFSPQVSASTVRVISDDILFGESIAAELRKLNTIADGALTFEQLSQQAKDLIQQDAKQYTDSEILSTKNQLLTDIADKADLTYVNGQLQLKADNTVVSDLQTVVASKVDAEWVNGQLVSKADANSVYTIAQIDTKFNNVVSLTKYNTDQNSVITELESHESRIYQNELGLGSKVDKTTYNALEGRVETAETSITQNATAIKSKASQTSVNLLSGEVSNLESTQIQQADLIASKVNKTEYVADQNGIVSRFNTIESVQEQQAGLISQKVSSIVYENDKLQSGELGDATHNASISGTNTGKWYRIALNNGNRAWARFIVRDITSSQHGTIMFTAGSHYNKVDGIEFTLLSFSRYSSFPFTKARILTAGTYDDQYLDLLFEPTRTNTSSNVSYWIKENIQTSGWTAVNWEEASVPVGYTSTEFTISNNDSVRGKLISQQTLIEQNESAINLRATKTEVNDLTGRMTKAEGSITTMSSEIELKVDVDGIVSSLNLSKEGIRIKASLIELDGTTLINSSIIQTAHIKNGAITNAKLGTAVVDTLQVKDGAITNAKISSLNADKINAGAIRGIDIYGSKFRSSSGTDSMEIIGGDIHLDQSNGRYVNINPDGLFGFNAGGGLRFQANSTLVTSSAFGTSNANVYLAAQTGYEARVVDMAGVPGDGLVGSYSYLPLRASGFYGNFWNINPAVTATHLYARPLSGGELRVTLNGTTDIYENIRAAGIVANTLTTNSLSGNSPNLFLRPMSGGEVRVTLADTTDNYQSVRAGGYYGNFLDKGTDPGIHMYVRPAGSGELRVTVRNTTETYLPVRASSLISEDGEVLFGSHGRLTNDQYNTTYLQAGTEIRATQLRSSTYIPVRASSFPTGSMEEYKQDITAWNESALEKIKQATICEYRLKSEVVNGVDRLRQGLVIGEGYNTPKEVIDGDGVEQYLMNSFSWKAIQELDEKIIPLENEVNWLRIENQDLRNRVKQLEAKIA